MTSEMKYCWLQKTTCVEHSHASTPEESTCNVGPNTHFLTGEPGEGWDEMWSTLLRVPWSGQARSRPTTQGPTHFYLNMRQQQTYPRIHQQATCFLTVETFRLVTDRAIFHVDWFHPHLRGQITHTENENLPVVSTDTLEHTDDMQPLHSTPCKESPFLGGNRSFFSTPMELILKIWLFG